MKKFRITVMRISRYDDLIEKYENPIEHTCNLKEGQVFAQKHLMKTQTINNFLILT